MLENHELRSVPTEQSNAPKSRWSFLDRFRRTREIPQAGPLSDKDISKQGSLLIDEAKKHLMGIPEFASEEQRIFQESLYYRSLERPLRVSTGFFLDRAKYDVILNESQEGKPIRLVMSKRINDQSENPDESIVIAVRNSGFTEKQISYSKSNEKDQSPEPNTWETVHALRDALASFGALVGAKN
jgi:hypothetical protein